ncbi:MAG: class I SAM-dependent methyltransferase [Myxococcota bacterium]|nr:class I SAM-dependent methyltransferase [Myxococcota bacterium]
MGRPAVDPDARRAALYAAVHRGTPGDVDFHRAQCAGAARVLELGCGYGRVACALAEAGHAIVGVEIDPAMLGIARASAASAPAELRDRLTLREGDARALELGALRFERVLLAHSTIYCFRSDDEVRAVLRGARAHLVPGGRLVIDAYAADDFHAHLDPDAADAWGEIARVEAAGRRWRVLERSDWDRAAQRVSAHYRHEPLGGGRAIETTIEHRYLLASQLESLLRDEGFEVLRIDGDFESTPFHPEAEHLVVVAERSATGS